SRLSVAASGASERRKRARVSQHRPARRSRVDSTAVARGAYSETSSQPYDARQRRRLSRRSPPEGARDRSNAAVIAVSSFIIGAAEADHCWSKCLMAVEVSWIRVEATRLVVPCCSKKNLEAES